MTRRALELLELRAGTGQLGTIMTIASPHQGADLATLTSAAHGGFELADAVSPPLGELRDAGSVIQLSEVGIRRLSARRHHRRPMSMLWRSQVRSTPSSRRCRPPGTAPPTLWSTSSIRSPRTAISPVIGAYERPSCLARAGVAPACISLPEVILGCGRRGRRQRR